MKTRTQKILDKIESLLVDLRIELLDNSMDTALSKAAKEMSRAGSSKGGKARAKNLSDKRRKEIASDAANARWGNPVVRKEGEE